MDRITRKELKTDKFALELGNTVTFFEEHRQEIVRYGGIVAAVAVLIAGYMVYQRHQHEARQVELANAIAKQEAPVGGTSGNGQLVYPTDDAKNEATTKAFGDILKKYPGTVEGYVAQYYLGAIESDRGNMAAAEKAFHDVAQNGDANYASLAKLSLSQIYFSDGRNSQAEKELRELMAKPTIFVSKEQATLALTQYLIGKDPNEARKLLEPLRGLNSNDAVRTVAISQLGQLPQQ